MLGGQESTRFSNIKCRKHQVYKHQFLYENKLVIQNRQSITLLTQSLNSLLDFNMAVGIGDYSHDHFKNLPNLNDARDNFLKVNGEKLVGNIFKDFFVENSMGRTFGLAMPHRHFDIPPGHLMVNYNGTSTAWIVPSGEGMDEPQPTSWSFSPAGNLLPTEFSYSKGHKVQMGEKEITFVTKFKQLLDEKNLTEMFGLCEYPGDDFEGTCEITMGSANINLKPKDVRHPPFERHPLTQSIQYPEGLKGTDTAWFFSPPLLTRGCRCTCDNRTDPHSHGAHVITQSG
jgi:hypothetical protein